jgi:uncharacterized membrane protein (UPF0127 family)
MKEMNFPLDMIWIDGEGNIVDITRDATPESYPTVFTPVVPAQYVLEVSGGFSTAHDIHIGDIAQILE